MLNWTVGPEPHRVSTKMMRLIRFRISDKFIEKVFSITHGSLYMIERRIWKINEKTKHAQELLKNMNFFTGPESERIRKCDFGHGFWKANIKDFYNWKIFGCTPFYQQSMVGTGCNNLRQNISSYRYLSKSVSGYEQIMDSNKTKFVRIHKANKK
jgi:hypothetical protein